MRREREWCVAAVRSFDIMTYFVQEFRKLAFDVAEGLLKQMIPLSRLITQRELKRFPGDSHGRLEFDYPGRLLVLPQLVLPTKPWWDSWALIGEAF